MRLAISFLLAVSAFAQPAPSFEVATIRTSGTSTSSIDVSPGRVTLRSRNLSQLLQWAFNVSAPQIAGPSWLSDYFYDISATAPPTATEDDMRLMLQTLMKERFKLAEHRETRETPIYILTVGKNGHKLKENPVEGSPSFRSGQRNLTGSGATVKQMTDFLARVLRAPLLDKTGLTGRYDYYLDINSYVTPEVQQGAKGGALPIEAPGIVASALQEQLGLKLDSGKAPTEMVVIDRIEKEPTEN
jgi:uncharacterized protein (TIGR03435 family)